MSNEDEKLGIEIIRRAVEEPLRMIVANAGLEGSVVVNEVKNGKGDYGYNARAEKYEWYACRAWWGNLFLSGVIDPAKVCRVALENAASIAGMLLTIFHARRAAPLASNATGIFASATSKNPC